METNLNERPHWDWGDEPGPVAVERPVFVGGAWCTQVSTTGALIVVDSYGLFTVTGVNMWYYNVFLQEIK